MGDDLLDSIFGLDQDTMDSIFDGEQEEQDIHVEKEKEIVHTTESTLTSPFVPNKNVAYTEYETINIPGQQPLNVQYNVPAKPTLEHEVEMWDIINEFESDAWSTKNMGLKSGFEGIDNALDGGVKPGFIVIAGDSNLGKSALISQLAWNISSLNENVYVMDFSLDDPMPDKLPRIIGAGSKVLLNAVKSPKQYTHMPLMLVRRKEALNTLRSSTGKYRAYDANFTTFVEDIEEEIKRIKILLDSAGQGDKKIVVFIDNMHDLNVKNSPGLQDKAKFDFVAQWCSDTAIKYNLSLIASAELKKLNGTRRPALDDIRETVKIKYEAKAVLLVYNEVHYKGESSDVYFMKHGNSLKQPVFEVHFAKNKFHSYKGRLFFEFYPEMARMEEADPQSTKHYASVVFGN